MKIQRLRINGWEVHDCDEITSVLGPRPEDMSWTFSYLNGDIICASGQVSYLMKSENRKIVDTGSTT